MLVLLGIHEAYSFYFIWHAAHMIMMVCILRSYTADDVARPISMNYYVFAFVRHSLMKSLFSICPSFFLYCILSFHSSTCFSYCALNLFSFHIFSILCCSVLLIRSLVYSGSFASVLILLLFSFCHYSFHLPTLPMIFSLPSVSGTPGLPDFPFCSPPLYYVEHHVPQESALSDVVHFISIPNYSECLSIVHIQHARITAAGARSKEMASFGPTATVAFSYS